MNHHARCQKCGRITIGIARWCAVHGDQEDQAWDWYLDGMEWAMKQAKTHYVNPLRLRITPNTEPHSSTY